MGGMVISRRAPCRIHLARIKLLELATSLTSICCSRKGSSKVPVLKYYLLEWKEMNWSQQSMEKMKQACGMFRYT
jgi:hypothetical protein